MMKKFTEWMHDISGALMVVGQTLIAAFGVIIILGFVVVVEIQRVAHGIQLFESEESAATIGAAVLVMLLLTLEFITHYVETKHNYETERESAFSLRIAWQWFRYFIGWSKEWEPRQLSPAQQIKSYSHLLTVTILALALGGSMSTAINTVQGTWIEGLQAIVLESSLAQMVEWVSGVLFALALVVGSQRITSYVAQRASETLTQSANDAAPPTAKAPVQQKSSTVQQNKYKNASSSSNVTPIAEWLIQAENSHIETCDQCGWETDPKESADSALRALRAHQSRYCDAAQDTEVIAQAGA